MCTCDTFDSFHSVRWYSDILAAECTNKNDKAEQNSGKQKNAFHFNQEDRNSTKQTFFSIHRETKEIGNKRGNR